MTKQLQIIRQKIDEIDDQILLLLKNRVDLMKEIGKIKKQNNLSVRDDQREKEKIKNIEQKAKELKLPPQLPTQLWTALFLYSEEIEK